ncbi:MAG TPA: hypothetical protein VFA75_18605 [Nevskia sp.]|nr:hypothetical protein [Nevskia sp.]
MSVINRPPPQGLRLLPTAGGRRRRMKFLGVEVPSDVLEAMEARMKSGSFTTEDLIDTCRRAVPGQSSDFHSGVAAKLMHQHRRDGTIHKTGRGAWRWVWSPPPLRGPGGR